MELEDLQQAGVLHLWRRKDSPRPEGLTWTSWAGQIIRYGILEALRQEDLRVMSPVSRALLAKTRQAGAELQQKLLREPRRWEIAGHMGVTVQQLDEALDELLEVFFSSDLPTEDASDPVDSCPDGRNQPDEAYELLQQAQRLRDAVRELPHLQRVVAEQVLFEGRAKKDIAAEQGVSQSSVSQALRLGVEKLTERMKGFR